MELIDEVAVDVLAEGGKASSAMNYYPTFVSFLRLLDAGRAVLARQLAGQQSILRELEQS